MGRDEAAEIDEAHRALGHYVTEFSWLIRSMRRAVEERLGDRNLASLALGEATASQISNAFFAILEFITELDDEEQRVGTRLRVEVTDAIKMRNDFAHGDWEFEYEKLLLWRTKPGRKGFAWTYKARRAEEIDALAEQLDELTRHVREFGWLCDGSHPVSVDLDEAARVRDIFRFQKGRIVRKGRYADRWPPSDAS